jgi:hypothetical protein
VTARGRRPGLALALAIAVAVVGRAGAAHAETAIAIVSARTCPPELRERIAQQIAGVVDDAVWSCRAQVDQEEPFRSAPPDRDGLQFWIDLTPVTEARLTLHDGRSDRFVVRRIPLPRGLDEIGREEIGQIVRSALLAARAGPEETLTRAEARAEVARWSQPRPAAPRPAAPPPAPPAPPARREPPPPSPPLVHLELGELFGAARAFASAVPVVAEIGLGGLARLGWIAGWAQASYQLPARDDATPVAVELSAFALRGGLAVSRRLGSTFEGRLGAGGGVTRMSFTPQSDGLLATAAPPGTFWYGTGRVFTRLDAHLGAHLVAALTVFLDVVGADVHYDLRLPDGTTQQVLAPYRLQPGVALGIAYRP